MALVPLSSILSLYPDNSTGEIEAVDIRNGMEALWNGINDNITDIAGRVSVSGDTMTGFLTLHDNPEQPSHAATREYVDNTAGALGSVLKTGDTMSGNLYLPNSLADTALTAATQGYADQTAQDAVDAITGVLLSDGSIELVGGYSPPTAQSVATRAYVDANTPSGVILSDGSIPMDGLYTPLVDQDVCTKKYSDDNLPTGVLLADGTIAMDGGYVPTLALDIATKEFVEANTPTGVILDDGSVPMAGGYVPTVALDVATKEFVEANSGVGAILSDGSVPMDGGYVPTVDLDVATKLSTETLANSQSIPVFVDYYIDKNGLIIEPTDNAPPTIDIDTRISLPSSTVLTPSGETLDNFKIIVAEVQFFTGSVWGKTGFLYSSSSATGQGVGGGVADEANVVIQTGSDWLRSGSNNQGGVHGVTGASNTPEPCRVHIVAYKVAVPLPDDPRLPIYVDFYVDYSTLDIIPESQTTATTIAISTNAGNRALSLVTTPNGDTLDNYMNLSMEVEIFNAVGAYWGNSDSVYDDGAGTIGVEGNIYDGNQFWLQSGSVKLFDTRVVQLGVFNTSTATTTAAPCRIHFTGVKIDVAVPQSTFIPQFTDFYIDNAGNEILATDNAPNVVMGLSERISIPFSSITTPLLDTLDVYTSVIVEIQSFTNSVWGHHGIANVVGATTGYGNDGGVADETNIVFQTGSDAVSASSTQSGGVHAKSGSDATQYLRAHIIAIKQVAPLPDPAADYLRLDGINRMNVGYVPAEDFDVTTKLYTDGGDQIIEYGSTSSGEWRKTYNPDGTLVYMEQWRSMSITNGGSNTFATTFPDTDWEVVGICQGNGWFSSMVTSSTNAVTAWNYSAAGSSSTQTNHCHGIWGIKANS